MSKASSKFSYLTFTLGFIVLVLAGFGVLSTYHLNKVEAQTGTAVTGHAWSDTIGWIEFQHNKNNKVTIDADGYFVGFAWSDNIGWLQFNKNLAGPDGDGPARINTDNEVVGWARFCAGRLESGKPTTDPNNTCTGTSRTDGWDGWVKFDHGKTGEVKYNSTSKKFEGYAWGSDVVGWIDMKLVGADLGVTPPPALVVSCSASPGTLPSGGGPVNFTASASGGSGAFTYKWLTNNNSTNVSFTETVTASKTHRVEVSDGSQTKTAECSVSVSNPPTETKYDLDVVVFGNGEVTGPGSIDCRANNPGKCSASINKDNTVSLIATPDSDQTILWSGVTCATGSSGSNCSFSMNGPKTVTVTFTDVCTENCGGEVKFSVSPTSIITNCASINCGSTPFYSPGITITNQTAGTLNISVPNQLANIDVSPQYKFTNNPQIFDGSSFSIPQGGQVLFRWKFNERKKIDPKINEYIFGVTGSATGFSDLTVNVSMLYEDLTQTPQ